MKQMIRLEEVMMFGFAFFLFTQLPFAWWWFLVFLFAPDLSMVGYLRNPQVGAFNYNFVHHKGVAVIVIIVGALIGNPLVQAMGIILFGHSSMDRIFGFGLKYPDSFQHTHLGMLQGGK